MKTVVIVGAGFAGWSAYLELRKHANVILLDKNNHTEYLPSLHLAITKKKNVSMPLNHLKGFKQEKVTLITKTHVITNKNKHAYDYAIIATGSTNKLFSSTAYALKSSSDAKKIRQVLPKAKTVCIIGGGYTGVEIATVLASDTNKKITLINSSKELLIEQPKKIQRLAKNYLFKHKAEIIFNKRVSSINKNTITLSTGEKRSFDLIITSAGINTTNPFVKEQTVTPYLHIKSNEKIFLAGDCSNLDVLPTAHNAMIQGRLVGKQIINHIRTGKYSKVHPHDWQILAMAFGRYWGTIPVSGYVIHTPFTGFLKWIIEKRIRIEIKYKIKLPV